MTDHEKASLANVKLLKSPSKPKANPLDITPAQLNAMLRFASDWDEALFLLALNAAYTPIDCQRLEWSMINRDDGTIRFDRTKSEHLSERGLPRICALWTRTLSALDAIRNASRYVFVSIQGTPANINTMNEHFLDCRNRVGIKKRLTFKHLRKSALTAAANDPSVPDRQVRLLAGHSAGIQDYYVVRKNVALACEAIERHYFGENE